MKLNRLFVILAFALILTCFIPILRTSLYSDDIHDFQLLKAYSADRAPGAWQKSAEAVERSMGVGRFAPFSLALQETLFTYCTTVQAYKWFVLLANLFAVGAFLFFLSALNTGINIAVWAVFYGSVIQFRVLYHDAYTSIHAMYPLLTVYIFLCLGFYSRFIQTGRKRFWAVALLFYAMAHLASEVGLVLALLLPVTAWALKVSFRRIVLTALPFAVISVLYLGYVLWLRSVTNPNAYTGLSANFDKVAMLTLVKQQIYGALPLSSLHLQVAIPTILLHQLNSTGNILSVLFIIVIPCLIFYKIYSRRDGEGVKSYRFFVLGLCVLVGPAIFIMPSLKYQQELEWGMAYLPVYIQSLGTATLITFIFYLVHNSQSIILKLFGKALFLFAIASTVMSFLFNSAVIDRVSYERGKPAEGLFTAVKGGILNDCEQGATLILTRDYIWRAPWLYDSIFTRVTGKHFIVDDAELWSPPYDSLVLGKQCYLLDCVPGNPIITSLYNMNCYDGSKGKLLKTDTFPCSIELIPAQQNIGYR